MKRTTILMILLMAAVVSGQQRNSKVDFAAIPATGPSGTVTLSLAEYNRLIELAARKPKTSDAAPLPFLLSRAAFKLTVKDQYLTGEIDIDGSVLEKGSGVGR